MFDLKRMMAALLLSVLLHGILLAAFMHGVNRIDAEGEGYGGFVSGAGLNITLGDIQRVDESVKDLNTNNAEKNPSGERETQSVITTENAVELMSQSQSLALKTENKQKNIGASASDESAQTDNGNLKGQQQAYYAEVMAILNAHKRYHKLARERGLQGTTVIRFSIAANGDLLSHELVKSSGEFLLDRSAEQMLLSSTPFPAFPETFQEESIMIELPVEYALNEHP